MLVNMLHAEVVTAVLAYSNASIAYHHPTFLATGNLPVSPSAILAWIHLNPQWHMKQT